MTSSYLLSRSISDGLSHQQDVTQQTTVRVKALCERDRRRLLMHFLDLPDSDRLLRFGNAASDELITRYVQRLDFCRDTLFGIFDTDLALVGVGHLAFVSCDTKFALNGATQKAQIAEFGLSVSVFARGRGIGTRLFERAAVHCRNEDVDTLYMQYLSANQAMVHIAHKAGMIIHRDHGEVDAYLKLAPANSASSLQEAVEEQVALLDYAFRENTRAAARWIAQLPSHLPNFKDGAK